MADDAVIIEFPTGVRRSAIGASSPRSVARIAQSLSKRFRADGSGLVAPAPLSIRLDDLSGVADTTIARLSNLALVGSLTPASAARLALRHADEVCDRKSGAGRPRRSQTGQLEIEATLIGDPFGNFALCLRLGEEWIGYAPTRALNRLFELCPADRGPACLLVGCDSARRTTTRLLAPHDWRQRLSDIVAEPAKRFDGHVLVVGGIPPRGERRRMILCRIEQAVRRGGGIVPQAPRRYARPVRKQSESETKAVRNLLTLIELAFPGLVEVGSNDEEVKS